MIVTYKLKSHKGEGLLKVGKDGDDNFTIQTVGEVLLERDNTEDYIYELLNELYTYLQVDATLRKNHRGKE